MRSRPARRLRWTTLAASGALGAGLAFGAVAANAADKELIAVSPPVISGTPAVGQTLACSPGTWRRAGSGVAVFPLTAYSWTANGLAVGGATAATYLVAASDGGKSVACVVNATFTVGTAGPTTTYRGLASSSPVSIAAPVASPSPSPAKTKLSVKVTPTRITSRLTPILVSAVVSSPAGAPTGRCAFDRRVRLHWKQAKLVPLAKGGKCRARLKPPEKGVIRFRVRYLPAPGWRAAVARSPVIPLQG